MDFSVEIIGIIAAIFTTTSFVPQVYKIWKTKSVENISLVMYLVMLAGVIMWLIYGININSISIILANVATITLVVMIVVFKISYRNKS